ncbi:MAG: MmgE/PrpD family protein [Deltaproteobacteria bacterium]|nr:MmgE/PrpD family protein [Deltaproteobacteria bacterium]
MTMVERLAAFVASTTWDSLSPDVGQALKLRVLDSLGCAIGALGGEPISALRRQVDDFGGTPQCTLIGGGRTAPDRAAFYNGALVRYLDFNDSYLAKGETCHPSDNLAAVLAACETAGGSGRDFLVALAAAYQVQCRLSDVAPVRARGFDHTTQGAYAVAAGVARALGLDAERTANAIAIAGTAHVSLRVTRTGALSHWKGLAYPNTAFGATHAAFLASRGITGPKEVFEGKKGLMQAITGPFEIDWSREGLDRVGKTILKKFNAEIHSQSAIEGILELRAHGSVRPEDVERIELDIFDVAHLIIGGGEEGDKTRVKTKEDADHSLPYMVAVAILDGQVMPEQYAAPRITRDDVQALLRRVIVRPDPELSRRFPDEHPCRIRVTLRDGRVLLKEKRDYEGFHTRPMAKETVVAKFERLAAPLADGDTRRRIAGAVMQLDSVPISELCEALAGVAPGQERP